MRVTENWIGYFHSKAEGLTLVPALQTNHAQTIPAQVLPDQLVRKKKNPKFCFDYWVFYADSSRYSQLIAKVKIIYISFMLPALTTEEAHLK